MIRYCDSSDYSIGYILGQKDDEGREVVIHYGGHALRPAERNYPITHKEGLALVEGIKYYHIYLIGRKFTVFTDHQALKSLPTNKDVSGRLARWAIHLQGYDFDIVYKPGKKHGNADALSRRTYPFTTEPKEDGNEILANLQHQLNTLFLDIAPDYSDNCATLASLTNTSLDNPPYYHVIAPHRPFLEYELSFNCDEWEDKKLNLVTVTDYVRTILQDEDEHKECNPVILLNNVTTNTKTSLREDQLQDKETGPMIRYKENQVLPVDDNVARRLILESHDFKVENGLLFHFYYPRGKGHKTERLIKQLVVPLNLKDDVFNLTMMLILLVTKVLKEPTKLSDKNIFGILCTQIFKPMLNHVLNVKEAKWISMQGNLLYTPFLLKRLPLIEYTWTSLVLSRRSRKATSIFFLSLIFSANFHKHFPLLLRKLLKWQRFFTMGLSVSMVLPEAFLLIKGNVSCQNWSKKYVKYSKLVRLTPAVTTPRKCHC